jgi:hypothetical protein
MSMSAIVNAQTTKILDVPYKTQPNNYSCQSTCLKIMAMYNDMAHTNDKSIESIYKEINEGVARPVKQKNAWDNIVWWLNLYNGNPSFSLSKTKNQAEAIEYIVKCINNNSPVIISTNNFKTKGHLVLIVGYINYVPNQSNPDFRFICHDPYGKFFPELHSDLYGPNRYDFGMSLPDGSENGVGKGVEITPTTLKRFRDDTHHSDYYVMIGKPD